jgi:hypothetical protein
MVAVGSKAPIGGGGGGGIGWNQAMGLEPGAGCVGRLQSQVGLDSKEAAHRVKSTQENGLGAASTQNTSMSNGATSIQSSTLWSCTRRYSHSKVCFENKKMICAPMLI